MDRAPEVAPLASAPAAPLRAALPLFQLAGIRVYLHFTWFIVAALEMTQFSRRYEAPIWGVLEYLALFLIVLMHEFGHAFACRQTGGEADRIVLWPLGGVAFVNPAPRPGAYLWSIAAGPLVNVLLVPLLSFALMIAKSGAITLEHPDVYNFVFALWAINAGLLIFNLLPIYPLDGGQIVRALLWFWVGPIKSLKIASGIGFVGAILFGLAAFLARSIWFGILAFFVFGQAQAGWRRAQNLATEAEITPPAPVVTEPPGDRR
jgi:Zn-dependent protease